MKLLVYSMESSGASTFAFFLAQRPQSVAVIDLWSECVAPPLDIDFPVIVKATVNLQVSYSDLISSFRPDRRILFVRDPVATYCSLIKYVYANMFGTAEEKLARFDEIYAAQGFDLVVYYEDFVAFDPRIPAALTALGWPATPEYYAPARSLAEILDFNFEASSWLKDHFRGGWGPGNLRGDAIVDRFAKQEYDRESIQKVAAIAPRLSRHYRRI
jgi:hypothetical protein